MKKITPNSIESIEDIVISQTGPGKFTNWPTKDVTEPFFSQERNYWSNWSYWMNFIDNEVSNE